MNKNNNQRYSLPAGFDKPGQVFAFKRKNKYKDSKFIFLTLSDSNKFVLSDDISIKSPTFSEIMELNKKEILVGVLFILWLVAGLVFPVLILQLVFGSWGLSIFLGFLTFFVNFIILGSYTANYTETKYIIKHFEKTLLLTVTGGSENFQIVDTQYEKIYDIKVDYHIAKRSWNKSAYRRDLSDNIIIKRYQHEKYNLKDNLETNLEVKHSTLDTDARIFLVDVLVDNQSLFQLLYSQKEGDFVLGKIIHNSEIQFKLGVMIALISQLWTIDRPTGGGGG